MKRKSKKTADTQSLPVHERVVLCYHGESTERIDTFLAATGDERLHSRSHAAALADAGRILINGIPCRKSHPLKDGDRVEVLLPPPDPTRVVPEDIPLCVYYEDEWLAVVSKPAGMTVHPAPGHRSGTFVNALAHRFGEHLAERNDPVRPGIVHRLDKDTSGLIVVAKDSRTRVLLSAMFQERRVEKIYRALVLGCPDTPSEENSETTIDLPIGRHPRDRKKMAVAEGGKRAITHYRVLGVIGFAAYLEIRLETGRTHQIRVHLAHRGVPVLGDRTYSSLAAELNRIPQAVKPLWEGFCRRHPPRQALHAHRLTFTHPVSGHTIRVEDPIPVDIDQMMHLLCRQG